MICKKCLYPDTKPDLTFKDGVCSACRYAESRKDIDWEERHTRLERLLENYRGKGHWDCILPVSGGKDSHYITYYMKEELNMNPLLICFVPNDHTELGRKNLNNIKQAFDVDCIEFYAKPSQYRDMQKFGFKHLGDHAYPEHLGIFSVPFLLAKSLGIELVVWAENTSKEFGGTEKKDDQFTEGLFKDKKAFGNDPVYHTLKPDNIKSIYLGDYIKWDVVEQVKEMKLHGFTTHDGPMEWTYRDYENLDTKYVALHDYFKYLKYGYGRACDQACIDIRNGRMTWGEGMEIMLKYDGVLPKKYLKEFLNDMNMTREEFDSICKKYEVP